MMVTMRFSPFTRELVIQQIWIYIVPNFIPIEYLCQSDKIGLFLTVFIHKDTRLGGLLRKISDIVAFPSFIGAH